MGSYNRVIMMGHLTRDPEIREAGNGVVCKFGIATNETWVDKVTEEKKEVTCFVDVEAWGRRAEVIHEYFKKGDPIQLEAKLALDQWEDKESGQNRSRHFLKLDGTGFNFLPNGGGNSNGGSSNTEEVDDENVPF